MAQNTVGSWLFTANGSAGPFNNAHMTYVAPTAPNTPGSIAATTGNTISPSNTIRWKAWGGASNQSPNPLDPTTAASNTEIIAINNSVRGQLPSADIRQNYYMTGSTWTIGGGAPSGFFPAGNEVGTSRLSNSTMETYQQGADSTKTSGTNCFTCHVSNTTGVSHVFDGLAPLF